MRSITTGQFWPRSRTVLRVYNKAGIAELLMQRYKEAGKDFERAIHFDHQYADALNNLGVIDYESKKYGKAIKQYEKAHPAATGFRFLL